MYRTLLLSACGALLASAAGASSIRPVLPDWAASNTSVWTPAPLSGGAINLCPALSHLLPPKCNWVGTGCVDMSCELSIGRCGVRARVFMRRVNRVRATWASLR